MWLDLLKHLQKILKSNDIAKDVFLGSEVPSQMEVEGKGCIILLRQTEKQGSSSICNELEVSFTAEAWIREDDPSLTSGYDRIAKLEADLEAVLVNLRASVGALNPELCVFGRHWQLLDFKVVEKRGSDESIRPVVGTEYTIEARILDLEDKGGIW